MDRRNYLIRLVLEALLDGDKKRHRLTYVIKNYEKELRQNVIDEMCDGGLVFMYLGEPGKGRKPVMARITNKGRVRLEELADLIADKSVWSI